MDDFEAKYPVRLRNSKTEKISKFKKACVTVSLSLSGFILFVLLVGAFSVWLLGNQIRNGSSQSLNSTAHLSEGKVCDNIPQVPILPHDFQPLHFFQSGWDKEGSPVWIIEISDFDFRKHEEIILHVADIVLIQIQCSMMLSAEAIIEDGTISNVSKSWGAITDMGEFSLLQLASYSAINVIKKGIMAWSPIFPNVKYGMITEASWIVRNLFGILSPMLGDVYHKLFMYGDKRQYIPAILDKIPRDQLPEKYGGYSNYTCRTQFCERWPIATV